MGMRLLDCTLRDGGYVNNWEFGWNRKDLVRNLIDAKIDLIEMGFLRNGSFSPEQTLYNRVEEMYPFIESFSNARFGAMIRPDWYDISQLTEDSSLVKFIRFAFYYKDRKLTENYCSIVRNRGYRVFLNAVNICSYSMEQLAELVKFVNHVHPDVMTIVDTFGSLTMDSLKRYYTYIEEHLDTDIGIACHLHDNMILSVPLMQTFLEISNKDRELVLDGSLNGMGRIPGNLPTEVLIDIVNAFTGKENYDANPVLDAVSNYILPIKEKSCWGYSPAFYQSGRLKVHRSYPEYYLKDPKLTLKDIKIMLEIISETEKKWAYDKEYADEVRKMYLNACSENVK
ncbi:MAG: hypothetical protein NC124_11080 [Clostridium sp.]|nr:hypothetical protein [Clostridium sp.]